VDAGTGRVLWRQLAAPTDCNARKFCDPGISSAPSAIPGAVFAGHLSGWLRAYDGNSGKVIWAVDTTLPVKTVTGVVAHGGGMSGPGPVVSNGYLVVNSGYGLYYHMPGNLLMVFAKDGG
jgi:polyvinyl alcohol dehydrogenase (cytochrome)